MAVEPLFAASKPELLKKVRINTATDEQVQELIDTRIQDVRIGFYEKLGESRVNQLLSYTYTDNPTSSDQRDRVRANSAEVTWLTVLLMSELPYLFMDTKAAVNERYNSEPLTRDSNEEVIDRLWAKLDDDLVNLSPEDDEDGYQSREFYASSVGPDTSVCIYDSYPGKV